MKFKQIKNVKKKNTKSVYVYRTCIQAYVTFRCTKH